MQRMRLLDDAVDQPDRGPDVLLAVRQVQRARL